MLDDAAEHMREHPQRKGSCVQLGHQGTLLVTGDLHDNPEHLSVILRLAKLHASPQHHVVFQEIIHSERLLNGVDLSHRMLLRIAWCITQYPLQVHMVLANHELAQMTGRGVSKGAGNSVELFRDGLDYAYADDAEDVDDAVARFIAALPLAVRTGNGGLVAHSLPSPLNMQRFDVDILNRELSEEDYRANEGSAYLMTWGRGHTDEQIASLAQMWNVQMFLLGHEHIEIGCEMKGPQVVKINSDHDQAAVLPLDLTGAMPSAEELMMSAIRIRALIR